MTSLRTIFFFSIACVISLAVVFFASRNMYASMLSVQPLMALDKWSCQGGMTEPEQWQLHLDNLTLASKLIGRDANIESDLGRLYEFKALEHPAWNKEAKENRQLAIARYRKATQIRPTWALAWLNLAQAKVLVQESDDEAFNAMRKAFEYGKWQEKVQHRLLWLTMGIWDVLPEDLRANVKQVVSKTLAQNYRVETLIVLALRFNWQNNLKALMKDEKQLSLLEKYEQNRGMLENMTKQQSDKLVC